MRAVGTILWALLLSVLASQPAFAERRIALVIGNSAYRNVPPLTNPENDAAAIAAMFRKANFDVVDVGTNLAINEMRRTLRGFGAKARDADVAVIYYAGHGLEVDGTNYLVPVDAQLESDTDVYDEALPLDRVMVAVDPARQLRLIILDACRDNPFARQMKRTIATRSVGRGLARVEPSNPNTLIAFAAKAGFTASDGDGKNSPFALALSQHLTAPGLDLRKAFGFVRDDVLKVTGNRQEPFIYGSLGGGDVALVPAPSAAPPPAPDQNAAIRHDYELAAQVGTREAWDSFIAAYPDGFYAKLAIAQRNKLLAEEARRAAADKAQQAADEQARAATEARLAAQAQAEAQTRAAEQARIAAEKTKAMEATRLAEPRRAQVEAQPKVQAEAQAKADDARVAAARAQADTEARAAQEAREAAEAKRIADEAKAAEAERARAAALAKTAEEEAKLAAARARVQAAEEEAKLAEARAKAEALQEAKAAEDARLSAETNAAARPERIDKLAALTPPGQAQPTPPAAGDVTKLLQGQLRRVGCNTGAVDGNWNETAQKSLALFNRHAGTTLDVRVASLDALEVVKSRTARVCPLVCDHGYKPDGDVCVKIVCRPGYRVGDSNACEKIGNSKPLATREAPAVEPKPRHEQTAAPPRQQTQSSGQVFCNQTGCRPIRQGCFIAREGPGPGKAGLQREVCP